MKKIFKLKRVAASFYEFDEQWQVKGYQRPETVPGYGPAGQWVWYWMHKNGEANDRYDTKREATAAMKACVVEMGYVDGR